MNRMLIVLITLSTLLFASCRANSGVELDASGTGGKATLKPGQTLTVKLNSNPSTGYGWQVTRISESTIKQVGEPEFVQPGQDFQVEVGSGGIEVFRFEAIAAGETTIEMVYVRPWETDVAPAETYTIQVTVK
jgi:inhibitor of cysteine peptidase